MSLFSVFSAFSRRHVPLAAAVISPLASCLTPTVLAVDKVWVDNSNQNWPTAFNWNPGGEPGTADAAIFNLGNVAPPYYVLFVTQQFQAINAVADKLRIDSNPITFTVAASTLTLDSTVLTETGRALLIGRSVAAPGVSNAVLENLLSQFNTTYGTLGADAGSSGTLNVNGGTFSVTGTGATWDLIIGRSGAGTINVNDGSDAIVADDTVLGLNAGASGIIAVNGSGSMWNSSGEVLIGQAGAGSLWVGDFGRVECQAARLGVAAGGSGNVYVAGFGSWLVIDEALVVGDQGEATFTTSNADCTVGGQTTIGLQGELTVSGGDFDVNGDLLINGGSLTSYATAHVDFVNGAASSGASITIGGNTTLTHSGTFDLQSDVTMQVSGATYRPSFTRIGTLPGPAANLSVQGSSTEVDALYAIDVGYGGTGAMTVSGGATVNAPNSAVGSFAPGSIGTLTITGIGSGGQRSTWISDNGPNLGLHSSAEGTISVLNGGLLRSSGMEVGASGQGTIIIDGAASPSTPSLLDMLGDLLINRGDVTASDGGRIQARNLNVAASGSGAATLTIEGNGSTLQQSGAWTTTIGHAASGSGQINVQNGGTFATGTGATTINATGQINLNSGGVLDAFGPITMNGGQFNFLGGTLHVDTFNGNLLNQGGMLAPGHSIGSTAISGHYTQQAAGTLQIEIADVFPGDWDVLTVQGNAILNGAIEVVLLNGFQPVPGNSFTILTTEVGNVAGQFVTINAPPGIEVTYTAQSVVIEVTEPACPADIAPQPNGNGMVNVQDLLAVISAWGPCANPNDCPADIAPPGPPQGNDIVNVQDLLAVISAWGTCP